MPLGVDVKVAYDESVKCHDISIDADGNLTSETSFDTAIHMSLFCDRRADRSQVQQPYLRRGWAGNEQLNNSDEQFGSLLWLLHQRRTTTKTLNDAQSFAQQALQWMIDQGFATEIIVTAYFRGSDLYLNITMKRDNNVISNKVYNVWKATEV